MRYPDDFEVVWDGGPLLPDRPSAPDNRWDALPKPILGGEHCAVDVAKAKEKARPKRLYTKKAINAPLQHRPVDPISTSGATESGLS